MIRIAVMLGLAATVLGFAASPAWAGAKQSKQLLVYVGTYTRGESEGIYVYRMDLADGALTPVGVVRDVVNPSFLAIHPNGRFLYAVNEISNFGGEKAGAVSSFTLDTQTGIPRFLNQQSSGGAGPCHLVVDKTGQFVLAANYGGGSVVALPVADDGRLKAASAFVQHEGSSVNPRRQKGPHAHSINLDSANRFAFAADLGLDKVLIYRFDSTAGTLSANDPAFAPVQPGSGPRHFAFHPSGRFAYVINELTSTITAFDYDARQGALRPVQTLTTLPAGFDGINSTAEIQVHPSGRFVYGSNRGHDSIALFAVDPDSGRLTATGHQPIGGKTPRNFGVDPTGQYLLAAGQSSDSITVFQIDAKTGRLTASGHTIDVPTPVCVKFLAVE